MRRIIVLLAVVLILPATIARAEANWTPVQAENLAHWMDHATAEGIEFPEGSSKRVRDAILSQDREALDELADAAAMMLLRAWRGRCCGPGQPAWWHIEERLSDADLRAGLDRALEHGTLDLYLRSIRPAHPYYTGLTAALEAEGDPMKRKVIQTNLARWRWMPSDLGERYLLVNIVSQQLTLWDRGQIKGRWRVIVGTPATRTPVFSAEVSGVVLNPWWEIPSSIAAEGIASFVRRSPRAARAKGYVFENGRYRQMPGDNNALGRMKLVMPNPYSVFLHDTSNRDLFKEESRAFSHGCIRVDRALPFAATLLSRDGWDLEKIEQVVESGETSTIPLTESLPLYVTYFTAEPIPSSSALFYEDLYLRDPVRITIPVRTSPKGNYGSLQNWAYDSVPGVAGAPPCPI